MLVRILGRALLTMCLVTCGTRASGAQTIGTFRWQASPFCNVITLAVVQVGTVFSLEGFDDQCGAATRASVVGSAFFNPDGTVGIGLTTIATPGGAPVHMDVALSLATLNGPWRDSAGNTGTFAFTPGVGTGGTPRPIGRGLGAAAIDPTQVQRRVIGACAAGSVVRGINEDGTVGCEAAGSGDITAVAAGAGLTGGATSGAAALAVAFGSDGSAVTAARSDHEHQIPGFANTAVGNGALSVNSGAHNTAVGTRASEDNTSGTDNTAFGSAALAGTTTGNANTGIGASALAFTSTGNLNTALGEFAGLKNTTGSFNTFVGNRADALPPDLSNASAFGALARVDLSNAIVLGSVAGVNNAASNVNVGIGTTTPTFPLQVVSADGAGRIHVGHSNEIWSAGERRVVSFGDGLLVSVGEEDADDRLVLRARTGGIRFKTASGAAVAPDADNAIPLGLTTNRWTAVYAVNGAIQTSDARWKTNIADLDYGLAALQRLRPVSFAWKDGNQDQAHLGLLAQEVEPIIPEAVVHGAAPDEPLGMNYSTLIPVLIKAIQEQQTVLEQQSARLDAVAPPPAAAPPLGGQLAIPVQAAVDPVAFTLCTPEGPGATQTCEALGFPASYQVPAGKRLIIEQVAGSCGGDAEQDESTEAAIVARTAGVIVAHPISGSPLPPGLAVRIPLTLTRIYANPQSLVTVGLTSVRGSNSRYCWLRFSGQFVTP